jgi:hypothetical protein
LATSGCSIGARTDPCLTLTPSSGPVGTHVRISGTITHDLSNWRSQFDNPAYFALIREFAHGFPGGPSECELLIGGDAGQVHLAIDGRVTGSFIVGASGSCFQRDSTEYPTQPGTYRLSVGCHACPLANFAVTSGGLPFTGRPTRWEVAAGLLLLLTGSALMLAGRRQSPIQ